MQRLRNTIHHVRALEGVFGSIQVGVPADAQALAIQITGRHYDTEGRLVVQDALIRLPLDAAIELHAALAGAISTADHLQAAQDPRQPAFAWDRLPC